MLNYIRIMLTIILISSFCFCNVSKLKNNRKNAADFVNAMDSLTHTLGPPADRLVTYHQKIKPTSKIDSSTKLPINQIDSLKYYYVNLVSAYDNAIENISSFKKFPGYDTLKNSFLTFLKKGKEAWIITIPIYLKVYQHGTSFINNSEVYVINSADSIYGDAANKTSELATIAADQQEQILKKYDLKYSNNKYK